MSSRSDTESFHFANDASWPVTDYRSIGLVQPGAVAAVGQWRAMTAAANRGDGSGAILTPRFPLRAAAYNTGQPG